ncbi:MAG: hypothetical protein HZA78_10860 [Candidatus Schekmanbacteria bacterium]|nr:hypothetical protein [Candidatus Schekmanbacteria bacterium]
MQKEVPVFWGCTITQRLPYLEATIHKVLDVLEVVPKEVEGFSCCPDPLYAKTLPHTNWLAVAARNLALAEQVGPELVIMCNGCYKVLQTAKLELRDSNKRAEVNVYLKQFGLEYRGEVEPVHFIQYLSRWGKKDIARLISRRLPGLSVAVHYGCHILRPRSIAVDNVGQPVSIEQILGFCGVKVVNYPEKHLCCGGTLGPFDEASSEDLIRRKVRSMKAAGADCMVVVCPSCFVQYDIQSRNLKKDFRLPVLHLMEVLALVFGLPVEELNLNRHTTDVSTVLAKAGIAPATSDLSKRFNLEQLRLCCGSCTYECNVAKSHPEDAGAFDPLNIVRMIVNGEIEKAVASPDIWRCVGCFDCAVFCPQNRGLGNVFETLRQIAIERGIIPEVAKSRLHAFQETGREAKGSEMTRKKLGLPATPRIEVSQIKCLLEIKK